MLQQTVLDAHDVHVGTAVVIWLCTALICLNPSVPVGSFLGESTQTPLHNYLQEAVHHSWILHAASKLCPGMQYDDTTMWRSCTGIRRMQSAPLCT